MKESIFNVIEQKRLITENGEIVYWVNDCNNSKETLIFLHGLTADHTLFEKQISYYYKSFKLICWDAPAHGKSRPYINFSYSNSAEHLKCILDEEKIKEAIFIGQSMGGYIIQTFYKKYSEIVKGFIGIDTSPFGLKYYSKLDVWWLKQIEWMSMCFPYNFLIKSIAKSCSYTKEGRQNMINILMQYSKKELCKLMGTGYLEFLKENCNIDIKCPVLIIVGEYDKIGKVKKYCKDWSKNTSFPLKIIPKAAHNSNFDNSETVNREIDLFINNLIEKSYI